MINLAVALTLNWVHNKDGDHVLQADCGNAQYQFVIKDKDWGKKTDQDFIKWFDEVQVKCNEKDEK